MVISQEGPEFVRTARLGWGAGSAIGQDIVLLEFFFFFGYEGA